MLSLAALLIRWLLKPLRFFFGYDVFVSYARKDGSEHLATLRKSLPTNITVRCDVQGIGNDATLGWRVFAAIAVSRVLAVISTEQAAKSKHVADEVRFFKTWNDGPAVPVEVNGSVEEVPWRSHIPGPVPVPIENAASRISDCVGFWRRS